jgi:hypothetical protein
MDGINPTLVFAALFFGLAGHPREAAESQIDQSQMGQPAEAGCSTSLMSLDPANSELTRYTPFESEPSALAGDYLAGDYMIGPMRNGTTTLVARDAMPLLDSQLVAATGSQSDVGPTAEALAGLGTVSAGEVYATLGCGNAPPTP